MKRIFRVLKYCIKYFIANILAFFIKLFCPLKRNIWIISERGDDARDNGYFFYRYLKENHPEIKVYYIIKSTSVDARKIASEDIIEPDTFKHFLYFALCRVRISTHAWGGDIPASDYYSKTGFYKCEKKKTVFLQHGITKDFQPSFCYPAFKTDLFICGAEPEYIYIRDNFGHPKGTVKYTGFARFDSLKNFEAKNQILVMPTFRKWIKSKEAGEDYFKFWNDVIGSEKLLLLLEENDYELVFYPHYMLQKYLNCFHSASARIHIAGFDDYDVQQLLKESKLLVTDFSSVFFDFAYMEKPLIYYQFDRERYIKDHYDYTKGYFDYDLMGFGPVVFDKENLIDQITKHIRSGCILEEEYKVQGDNFFKLKDSSNSDRIYNAIIEMLKK